MKLLVLGGTQFLGRHVVEAALARGHALTLFNRGRTNPELFPEVERLVGDREGDVSRLEGRHWDAVLDTSGYLPKTVRASCAALRECGYYLFVSSISAYADNTKSRLTEEDAVAQLSPGTVEELTAETYGPLKALCEGEVLAAFPGRSAIVRPGLIFGPHDATDRSRYWPTRMERGGDVLAPGPVGRPIQLIDVRDLAEWIVMLLEGRATGVFNATGPREVLKMGAFLETCRQVTRSDARLVWVDEQFLLDQKVGPYSELPLWVPERLHAFEDVNCSRAFAAGLTIRPLAETLAATHEWSRTLPAEPRKMSWGRVSISPPLTREREAEVLAAWRARATA